MDTSPEITPLILNDQILEGYSVSHETLVHKRNQVELFTAHYEDDSGEQNISTAFIPGNGSSKETIIVNVAWSDSAHREFNLLRYSALAEHTEADIVLVGFPGYDEHDDSTLTPIQLESLTSKGDHSFSEVGKALASAVDQMSVLDSMGSSYWKDRDVTIAGYSQGSSSQIGMFEHLSSVVADRVTHLVLWESPDALESREKITKLGLKSFIRDALKTGNRYFLDNEVTFGKENAIELGIHDKGIKGLGEFAMMMMQKRGNLTRGALDAMAGSTLEEDMKRLYLNRGLDDVEITVIHGDDSLVSTEDMNQKIIRMLLDKAPKTGEKKLVVRSGGSHGLQESFVEHSSVFEEVSKK